MTKPSRILLSRPSITDLEVKYAADAARNGWGAHCYDYIHRYESAFATHMGVRYAIATSSCTGALHMGLAAMGVGVDDEVILADTNWVATVAPVMYLGAKPVLVDILESNWCIDPAAVRAAITPRTKAIMAVHLYGNVCDMDALQAIGAEYGVPVIEDAAEAIGSRYHSHRAGSMGLFGGFSFHGSKTISTGEGGMFVTNDATLYEKVLTLSNHGRARGQTRQFWPDELGFKYKMSNLQAALGCAQLERVEELVTRKREILHTYQKVLAGIPGLSMNLELPDTVIGAWMPSVVLPGDTGVTVDLLLQSFIARNIDARPFFSPLSSLPWMEGVAVTPNAKNIALRAVNLPSYHDMTDADIQRVAEVIQEVLNGQ